MIVYGLIAILVQIVIAPNIRVAGATPDLVLVIAIIVSLRLSRTSATVFGFCLGFLLDLVVTGPFGLMTLILTVLCLVVSTISKGGFGDHWIVELGLVLLALLFAELLYGVAVSLVNPDTEFIDSLIFIILPTTIYNIIIAIVMLIIAHLLGGRNRETSGFSGKGVSSSKGRHAAGNMHIGSNKLSGPSIKLPGHTSKSFGQGNKLPGRSIKRKLR